MKEGDRFRLKKSSALYGLFGDRTFIIEQIDVITENNKTYARVLFFIDKVLYFELERHIDVISHNEYHNLQEIKKIIIQFKDGRIREYNNPKIEDLEEKHIKISDGIYDKYNISISINNIY